MQRRDFLAALGAGTAGALAGCIETTPQYGYGDTVDVREGTISLVETRPTQTLLIEPSDTPPRLLGEEQTQYLVFVFDTSALDVEEDRDHDYLSDFLQFQLSPDTVAPPVDAEPRSTAQQSDRASVAFEVGRPFQISEEQLRWLGDTAATWPAQQLLSEHEAYLSDPPTFSVDSVDIPDTATTPTASITLNVTNSGGTAGAFNAIVRGDETEYVSRTVGAGETATITTDIPVTAGDQPILVSWGVDQRSAVTTVE